jgi:hypothetical protein
MVSGRPFNRSTIYFPRTKLLLKKQQNPFCGNLELEELGNLSDKCLKMTLWTTPLFKATPVTPL